MKAGLEQRSLAKRTLGSAEQQQQQQSQSASDQGSQGIDPTADEQVTGNVDEVQATHASPRVRKGRKRHVVMDSEDEGDVRSASKLPRAQVVVPSASQFSPPAKRAKRKSGVWGANWVYAPIPDNG